MRILLTAFLLFIGLQCFSQIDQNGNPIFNSVTLNEEVIKDFKLIANYYTLKNNIDNKGSSVFISENPSLDQIANAAMVLPSDFFVVVKGQSLLNMVLLTDLPTRKYMVINPSTGKQTEFACSLKGDITENRAMEIMKENYAPDAKIEGSLFYFNGKKLRIISNREIRNGVVDLIEKQKLNAGESSKVKMLSKDEIKMVVLEQSKPGGRLDFFTEIKGREMEGIQIKPGLFDTRIGIALYNWGRANFDLGVNTIEDALAIWAELKGRPANQREKDYIKLGFDKDLEK
jgi:acyl-CoA-binding protein